MALGADDVFEVPHTMSSPIAAPGGRRKVRVWDLPTRVFHWLLALLVIGLIVTAKAGGNAMEVHFKLGYAVLALLVFRLIWGFVGGRWSRFSSFFFSPAAIVRYLRGRSAAGELSEIGHSPLGSLSVFALLAVLAAQVVTGLMSDDEIAASGPLVRFVSGATSEKATFWHTGPGQWIIIGLVALHVLAVLFYVIVKRKRLVRPMISGDKPMDAEVPPSRDDLASRVGALVALAVGVALALWVAGLRV